jgi:membrane glycosyltransferase
LHAISRLHFALGILSYVSSPLWLAFLGISTVLAFKFSRAGAALRPAPSFDSYLPWSFQTQAIALFLVTVVLLLLPKILAVLDLKSRPAEVAAFGGWGNLLAGIVSETVVFTLLAPILMLFHTKFLVLTLGGRSVSWGQQRRGRAGESVWQETVVVHASHTVIGVLWAMIVLQLDRTLALWMSPVLASLIFSIPLSFCTGALSLGLAVRRQKIFLTPDETQPVPELARLAERVTRWERRDPAPELAEDYGLLQAVMDPYVNAAHVALLRVKDDPPPASEERFAALRTKLLHEGPAALTKRDKISLLLDVDSMTALHHDLWTSPASRLAAWWTLALDHYNVVAPAPQTALTR